MTDPRPLSPIPFNRNDANATEGSSSNDAPTSVRGVLFPQIVSQAEIYVLQSSKDRKSRKKRKKALPIVCDVLPKVFIPRLEQYLRPPVYRYGYAFDLVFLESFAKEHGCYRTLRGSCDHYATIHAVVDFIQKNAPITSCKLRDAAVKEVPNGDFIFGVFSLYSNYESDYFGPSRFVSHEAIVEDVHKLQRALGKSEEPKWYMDYNHDTWADRPMTLRF